MGENGQIQNGRNGGQPAPTMVRLNWVLTVAGPVLTLAACWGAFGSRIAALEKGIDDIRRVNPVSADDAKELRREVDSARDRLTRMEGKVDLILEELRSVRSALKPAGADGHDARG